MINVIGYILFWTIVIAVSPLLWPIYIFFMPLFVGCFDDADVTPLLGILFSSILLQVWWVQSDYLQAILTVLGVLG